MLKIPQVHDSFFKSSLKDLTIARDFIQQYLAPDISAQLDFSTLQLCPTGLVTPELEQRDTDILFKCNFKAQRRPAYLILHLEHQSTSPIDMALRMLGYKVGILQQAQQYGETTHLPVIISMLVYTGKKPFSAVTDFYELFGDHQALAKQVMFNGYQLIDLSTTADETLATHQTASLFEWVFKHARDANFMQQAEALRQYLASYLALIDNVTTQHENHLVSVTYYLLSEADIPPAQLDEFFAILQASLPPQAGEKVMGLAHYIEQQGIEKGMQRGIQQGIQRERQSKQSILERLIIRKFGVCPDKYRQMFNMANSERVSRWIEGILDAEDLEDLFND